MIGTANDPWFSLAGLLIIGGLLGTVLPMLPGTPLIFLGALVYDFGHQWRVFGPLWLGVLLLLALVAVVADWLMGTFGGRKGGASWPALIVGFFAGLVGLFVFSLPGMLLGTVGGVVGTELIRRGDAGQALKAGGGWL
ncbi:MAG TPA: DUF456 domain-containing protein, partial [Ardenticatenaceae bacterium]|nr:DUF456 domain-containing protein [Ardenticatenaceae bacterium]